MTVVDILDAMPLGAHVRITDASCKVLAEGTAIGITDEWNDYDVGAIVPSHQHGGKNKPGYPVLDIRI